MVNSKPTGSQQSKDRNVNPAGGVRGRRPLAPLLPLYIVIFVGFAGYSLTITVFTPLLLHGSTPLLAAGDSMRTRTIVLGILLCLYPLGQFVGSPILGWFSDRFGRKPVLMISLVVTTACYALIALSLTIGSMALLVVASIVAGLSEANIVAAQSAIADVAAPADRNRFFGYIYMSVSSAYIVGPLVGGKLADPALVSWFNDSTPFWTVCFLLVITTAATAVFFHETHTPGPNHGSAMKAFTNLADVFTNRRLRALYWLNFLLYLAIFGFFRCYPMYLVDRFHMGVSQVSEFIAWVGVPIVLANLWLTSFLSRRYAVKTITVWSGLLTGVFMLIVVIPPQLGVLWITLFLTSGALALSLPSCATLLSVAASQDEQGCVMGNNQALQVGAEALSGIVGGLLAAVLVKLSLIVMAAIAILAAVLLKFHSRTKTPHDASAGQPWNALEVESANVDSTAD
jgi:DHA1 family tetracycline resistance protein-like MFS transporter